jgi:helix-turn-helix protein
MAKTTIIEKSRGKFMASIPTDEMIYAMKDLSPKAYQLLMYYYTKGNGWVFNDAEMADTLGIGERMLNEYRRELVSKKYLLIIKGKVTLYFVGRSSVMDFESPDVGVCHE